MSSLWCSLTAALCGAALTQGAAGMEATGGRHLQNASFLESTYLIDLQQGSPLSQSVVALRTGGYELSGGRFVSFNDWYRTKWTDVSITWMTQVSKNLGIIFGANTGERGKKYTIEPGLKLGLLMQSRTGKNAFLALRATTILGGALREKSCTADYGDIGGIQEVNCRLAASTIPPPETLKYLVHDQPHNRNQVSLMLTWHF